MQIEGLYRHASHPCRRRRDRRPAADRAGAAVSRSALRLPGHAILDEVCRAGGTGEIRLPRPDHADHPANARGASCAGSASRSISTACRWTTRRPSRCWQRGDAGGVFQMEGQGMRDMLRQMRPDRFEDLIAARARCTVPARWPTSRITAGASTARPGTAPHPMIHDILSRDLRHHRLPGTGDADRPDDGRLLPGRRRSAAPRDGQEDPARRWRPSARSSSMVRSRAASIRRRPTKCSTLMAKFADYGFNKMPRRRLMRCSPTRPPG